MPNDPNSENYRPAMGNKEYKRLHNKTDEVQVKLGVGSGFNFGFGFGAGVFIWGLLLTVIMMAILETASLTDGGT